MHLRWSKKTATPNSAVPLTTDFNNFLGGLYDWSSLPVSSCFTTSDSPYAISQKMEEYISVAIQPSATNINCMIGKVIQKCRRKQRIFKQSRLKRTVCYMGGGENQKLRLQIKTSQNKTHSKEIQIVIITNRGMLDDGRPYPYQRR